MTTDHITWQEKPMTLNGHPLEQGDVMTIRVALNNFLMDLSEGDLKDLGPIGPAYKARVLGLLERLSA